MMEVGFPWLPSGTSPTIERPLPQPLPRREGRDYRDTPTVLLFVAYGVICSCVYRCTRYSVSYLRCIKILVYGVYSVILCLSVILSININNTTKHVLFVIICHSVILSLYIKFPFSMYVSFISVTYIKSGGCRLRWRRALSSIKKGVFLDVEGHVLEWRRACSWKEWGSGVRADGCWVMGVRCWWLALVGVGWWLLGVDD